MLESNHVYCKATVLPSWHEYQFLGTDSHRQSSGSFAFPWNLLFDRYSDRKASIGLSLAARRAGKYPKITPITAENKKAIKLI